MTLSLTHKKIRKYYKNQILPPLRDLSKRPEEGNTMRNKLCRLLTTPDTTGKRHEYAFKKQDQFHDSLLDNEPNKVVGCIIQKRFTSINCVFCPFSLTVGSMIAEFMFILCKEKVGRFVKHTGYGKKLKMKPDFLKYCFSICLFPPPLFQGMPQAYWPDVV